MICFCILLRHRAFLINGEIFSAGRLDNMTSVQACVKGIKSNVPDDGFNMAVIYDSEEVGSGTKQGAGSVIIRNIIDRDI